MEHSLTAWAASLALALAGCGDDEDPQCGDLELTAIGDRACLNAHVLAARYTDAIRPGADEIAAILDAYRSALVSNPTLCFIRAKMWWSEVHRVEIIVDEPDVASAWARGELTTGNAAVDDALAAGGAAEVSLRDEASGLYLVTFRYAVNPENLQATLAQVGGVTVRAERYVYTEGEEIALEPASAAAGPVDVIFRYGWGDCAVQCDGNHWWRVHVATDRTAELVEEWGAEIPADELPRMDDRAANECEP